MVHLLWQSAHDHVIAVAVATANLAVAVVAAAATVLGAHVNDGLLVGAVLFVLGTGTGIAGWALVLLVHLSNVVARLETTTEDHERRLNRVDPGG